MSSPVVGVRDQLPAAVDPLVNPGRAEVEKDELLDTVPGQIDKESRQLRALGDHAVVVGAGRIQVGAQAFGETGLQ